MNLPQEAQRLVAQYLELINLDTEHHIRPLERFKLYQSFGISYRGLDYKELSAAIEMDKLTLSVADGTLIWLAILTVQKVLPIWEQGWRKVADNDVEDNMVVALLEAAKGVVARTTSLKNLDLMLHGYHDFLGQLAAELDYNAFCADRCCAKAVEIVVLGLSLINLNVSRKDFINEIDDEGVPSIDFAAWAAKAWSAVDENYPPGNWSLLRKPESLINIKFDAQRRLEFWNWWLTEAIPQAWELAEQV